MDNKYNPQYITWEIIVCIFVLLGVAYYVIHRTTFIPQDTTSIPVTSVDNFTVKGKFTCLYSKNVFIDNPMLVMNCMRGFEGEDGKYYNLDDSHAEWRKTETCHSECYSRQYSVTGFFEPSSPNEQFYIVGSITAKSIEMLD